MSRLAARIALILLALGALIGFYYIPMDPKSNGHVWFIHTSHLLVGFGFILALIVAGVAVIFLTVCVVVALWDAAK
jgi:hypothetical protein